MQTTANAYRMVNCVPEATLSTLHTELQSIRTAALGVAAEGNQASWDIQSVPLTGQHTNHCGEWGERGEHGKRRKDQPVQAKTYSATRQRAFYNENTSCYKYNLHSSPAPFLGFQVPSTRVRQCPVVPCHGFSVHLYICLLT